jgi:hypothetical protein
VDRQWKTGRDARQETRAIDRVVSQRKAPSVDPSNTVEFISVREASTQSVRSEFLKANRIKLRCLAVVSLIGLLPFIYSGEAAQGQLLPGGFRTILDAHPRLSARGTRTYPLTGLNAQKTYSLSVSLPSPESMSTGDTTIVTLRDGGKIIATKTLHIGDADLYLAFRPLGTGAELTISSSSKVPLVHDVDVLEWPVSRSSAIAVETEPNDSWREANTISLGQTVWSTADDKPYIAPETESPGRGTFPYQNVEANPDKSKRDVLLEGGIDWFKFTFDEERPKLIYFEVDLPERDNIPVDVSVFTIDGDQAKPYEKGIDPVSPPHEVQALAGNKFSTRVITKGTYYIRVDANHPFYQLRTSVYDVPPYSDPRLAVRVGMDYLVSAGESWHANTPRHGGIVNRVSSVHAETTTCIACHATHFTSRGELIAKQNGYPVLKRPQLEFLAERLYNNPRPFYGHSEATWARVISASANVMSRLASLLNLYESELSGERRLSLLKGAAGYLKIYYKGRTVLPPDESNGNTPLVSTYEVAFYSWKVFDELYRQSGEIEAQKYRDQIRRLIEQDQHKNMVDLCYQTIALATIDRSGYAQKIRRNSERILSLQRSDGQWSMLFEPDSPAVEFQTGHALYALALAGYPVEEPHVAKGLAFVLNRQQEFGGWFDRLQSYENFRTPFRETQFAVMALSEFYKGSVTAKGWDAGFSSPPARLSESDHLARLDEMDRVWVKRDAALGRDLLAELGSAEAMHRVAAAVALGRTGDASVVTALTGVLGDPNKMVQIASAQAIRKIAVRTQQGTPEISQSLSARRSRVRWGATRIFAQHFSALTDRPEFEARLQQLATDVSPAVRMQAIKALAQWYYWTKDEAERDRIADMLIARMAVREHAWVRRNLLEAFYSIADENVRYLYDNWIALLPTESDKTLAIKAHHEQTRRMAERVARGLITGNELQREGLLQGLTEFHLRTGGYASGGRYTRIGNDVETIRFYQEGAPELERALRPILESPNAHRREQGVVAAFTLRDDELYDLPLLVMERLIDPDASVRAVAAEFYRALPLKIADQNRQEAVRVLKALLSSGRADAQVAALDRIRVLGHDFAQRERFDEEIKGFVLRADEKVAPAAIRALADFPALAADAEVQDRLARALNSSDQDLLRAGVQLVLARPELRSARPVAAALDTLFSTEDATKRRLILGLIGPQSGVEDDLRLLSLVVESLGARDEQVRAAALGVVRRVRSLLSNAAIRLAVNKLTKDPNQRLQGQAIALYQGQDGSSIAVDGTDASRPLDFDYFVERVMPILERKGADGNACINCHATHTIFRLHPPDTNGRYSDGMLRENYSSALRVVDLSTPENSLILRKPTSNSEQEGVVGAKKLSHGGGQRWPGADDPAYRTIIDWINGARLASK